MKKSNLVTVGIPAYNEESNIAFLIEDLLKQKQINFKLEKIFIVSDGSTDDTVKIARSFSKNNIAVFDKKERKGEAYRLNELMSISKSNALVILNSDIRIKDKMFLEKICSPLINEKVDLASTRTLELPARNFLEKVIKVSMELKKSIFCLYKQGSNIYTCHGRVRAFSKKLYKKIKFRDSIGEDAYSYLYCIKNSFSYRFVQNTEIFYKLPDSFLDHTKQSIRYFHSKKKLIKKFGRSFVEKEYQLPLPLIVFAVAKFFVRYPIETFSYMAIVIYLRIKFIFVKNVPDVWPTSKSTKILKI